MTPDIDLAEVRRSRGLTQADMAARLGVTQARVSAIERAGADQLKVSTLWAYFAGLGETLTLSHEPAPH